MTGALIPSAVTATERGREMSRKQEGKVKGVYERPAGFEIWWVNYYAEGKRHREKAGRRSDAIALYQKRELDARRKIKIPELLPGKSVTFGMLSAMAVAHATTHLKTTHDHVAKHRVLLEPFWEPSRSRRHTAGD